MNRLARKLLASAFAFSLAGQALAGVILRTQDERPQEPFQALSEEPRAHVAEEDFSIWSSLIQEIQSHRQRIQRPAVQTAGTKKSKDPIPDGFLPGFAQEPGLKKKLEVFSEYRVGMGRTYRWLMALDETQRGPFRASFSRLAEEVTKAQLILVGQIRHDLRMGGRALEFTAEFVEGSGLTGEAAQDAFGPMSLQLKHAVVSLANDGSLDEETRVRQSGHVERLEKLLRE